MQPIVTIVPGCRHPECVALVSVSQSCRLTIVAQFLECVASIVFVWYS